MVLPSTERDEITNEANNAVKHRCTKPEVVKRISELTGLSEATVYDYLTGRIKMNLRFLKAVVAVTEDPFLKKYLEPQGMYLVPSEEVFSPTDNWDKESFDVVAAISVLREKAQELMTNGKPTKNAQLELLASFKECRRELDELEALILGRVSKEKVA